MSLQEEDATDVDIERLWPDEAKRRLQELIDGKVKAIPGEEAVRRGRSALDKNLTSLEAEVD